MRDSVPSARYSSVCNVLRQWRIWLIPTYRVYRLYDKTIFNFKQPTISEVIRSDDHEQQTTVPALYNQPYIN